MQKLIKLTADLNRFPLVNACLGEAKKVAEALAHPDLESGLTVIGDESVHLTHLLVRRYKVSFPLDFGGVIMNTFKGECLYNSMGDLESLIRFIEFSQYNPIVCVAVANAVYKYPTVSNLYSIHDQRFMDYISYVKIVTECLYDLFENRKEVISSSTGWYVLDRKTSNINYIEQYGHQKDVILPNLVADIITESQFRFLHAYNRIERNERLRDELFIEEYGEEVKAL